MHLPVTYFHHIIAGRKRYVVCVFDSDLKPRQTITFTCSEDTRIITARIKSLRIFSDPQSVLQHTPLTYILPGCSSLQEGEKNIRDSIGDPESGLLRIELEKIIVSNTS